MHEDPQPDTCPRCGDRSRTFRHGSGWQCPQCALVFEAGAALRARDTGRTVIGQIPDQLLSHLDGPADGPAVGQTSRVDEVCALFAPQTLLRLAWLKLRVLEAGGVFAHEQTSGPQW